jgi:DNA repair photolyase
VRENNKHDEELNRLMSFLAESVAEMSEDQIKEEYRSEARPRTKEILQATLNDLNKQKLREARSQYESAAKELSLRRYKLPADRSGRRALLSSILAQRPDLRSVAFTAHHRELKDFTDSDVESFLKQLAELGLLPFPSKGE